MRKSIVFTVSLALYSCGYKNIKKEVDIIQGTYKGQFVRSSPLARYAASSVTIDFSGNTFAGVSDKPNYPAICRGRFKINGKTIEFINECNFTADFDWSYVLKDRFEFNIMDGKLEMTKSVGDTIDHYSLTLQ